MRSLSLFILTKAKGSTEFILQKKIYVTNKYFERINANLVFFFNLKFQG